MQASMLLLAFSKAFSATSFDNWRNIFTSPSEFTSSVFEIETEQVEVDALLSVTPENELVTLHVEVTDSGTFASIVSRTEFSGLYCPELTPVREALSVASTASTFNVSSSLSLQKL